MRITIRTITSLAIIAALLVPLAATAESDSSHLNRARKDIGRQLIEVQSDNWPTVLQYYTSDIEYHDPIVTIEGIETMTQFLAMLFTSSPNLVTTIEDEICINDIYTASWTMEGFFNEVPYSAKGMSIIKFLPRETLVYYQRDYYTESDIMINIPSLDEAAEAFRTYYRCFVDPTFDCPLDDDDADAGSTTDASTPELEGAFALGQNAPNPFNPATTIAFTVPEGGGNVTLRIYDVSGRLVRTLVDGFEAAGTREVSWDGRDDQGQQLASGVYHYQLTAPSHSERKRMVLLK
jgi:hypothetical protein